MAEEGSGTTLIKVEDLIHLAMGPQNQNVVQFRTLEKVLFILAKHMTVLGQKVEVPFNVMVAKEMVSQGQNQGLGQGPGQVPAMDSVQLAFGSNGKPITGPGGVAIGSDGRSITGPGGVALGPDGRPILGLKGIVFRPDGKSIISPERISLNSDGTPITGPGDEAIGLDGKPIIGPDGIALRPNGWPITDLVQIAPLEEWITYMGPLASSKISMFVAESVRESHTGGPGRKRKGPLGIGITQDETGTLATSKSIDKLRGGLERRDGKQIRRATESTEPVRRSDTGKPARVGSVEVVTRQQFDQLEATVDALAERTSFPLPPTLPDNQELVQGILAGNPSLTNAVSAIRLQTRISAAEKAVDNLANMLSQLVKEQLIEEIEGEPEIASGQELLGPGGKPIFFRDKLAVGPDGNFVTGPGGVALGIDGKPITGPGGVALGIDGKPITGPGGVALGIDGKPITGPGGVALGIDGKPITGPGGVALGIDGKPITGPGGVALGIDGKPITGPGGVALGIDGKPITGPGGVALGIDGNPITGPGGIALGIDGKPITGPGGVALGIDGKPITGPGGVALGIDGKPITGPDGVTLGSDGLPLGPGEVPLGTDGIPITLPDGVLLGMDGKPVTGSGGVVLGPDGQPIGLGGAALGTDGKPINGPGGVASVIDGKPIIGPGGVALSPDGQLLGPGGIALETDGKPITGRDGVALGPDGQPLGSGGVALGIDGKTITGPGGVALGPDGLIGPDGAAGPDGLITGWGGEASGSDGKLITRPSGQALGPDGGLLIGPDGKVIGPDDRLITELGSVALGLDSKPIIGPSGIPEGIVLSSDAKQITGLGEISLKPDRSPITGSDGVALGLDRKSIVGPDKILLDPDGRQTTDSDGVVLESDGKSIIGLDPDDKPMPEPDGIALGPNDIQINKPDDLASRSRGKSIAGPGSVSSRLRGKSIIGPSRAVLGADGRSIAESGGKAERSDNAVPSVTHGEMEDEIKMLRSDVMKYMQNVLQSSTSSVDATSTHINQTSREMELALDLHDKLHYLLEITNNYFGELDGFESGITTQLQSFRDQMMMLRSNLAQGLVQMDEIGNNADTSAILELREQFNDLVTELDAKKQAHQVLAAYQSELANDLKGLVDAVEMMREEKADWDEVLDGLRDKADSLSLAGLLSERDFQNAREDLEFRIETCYDIFRRQDKVWQSVIDDFTQVAQTKADGKSIASIHNDIQDEMQDLHRKVQNLTETLKDPKAAVVIRKLARGAACASCTPALMEPTEPQLPPVLRPMPPAGPRPEPAGAEADDASEEPCLRTLVIELGGGEKLQEEGEAHLCRRVVGGSHTLIGVASGRGAVTREQAGSIFTSARAVKQTIGYGSDGKMYNLEDELAPCVECNQYLEKREVLDKWGKSELPGGVSGAVDVVLKASHRVTLVDPKTARRVMVINDQNLRTVDCELKHESSELQDKRRSSLDIEKSVTSLLERTEKLEKTLSRAIIHAEQEISARSMSVGHVVHGHHINIKDIDPSLDDARKLVETAKSFQNLSGLADIDVDIEESD